MDGLGLGHHVDHAAPERGSPPAGTGPLQFGLLGALSVSAGGRPVELPGGRVRTLLALLLVQANHPVSADRLIEDLWAGEPTPGAGATLQGYVSELRKALADATGAPAPVLTRRPGYLVAVGAEQLDILGFEGLIERARAAVREGVDGRAGLLRQALALWRGPALADFAGEPFARPVAARLEETRLWALEERVEAELGDGHHAELAAELPRLIDDNPLRERLWGQWMLALYRCGRQAEALRAYQDLRRRLAEELAIDPSPALQRLEQAILLQDQALEPVAGWRPVPIATPAIAAPPIDEPVAPGLPIHLTRFLGRVRELGEARQLLAGTRLLTLAGSGGSGKTRLAVHLAGEVATSFRHGVRFVDLSAVATAAQVPAALAAAMGLERQGADADDLCARLADRHVLLLFDNCEHVVGACAALIETVLARCPGATVLATTQEELSIGGETVWRVPPLALPPAPDRAPTAALLDSEAVQLFLDRATAASPGFLPDRRALESVASICRRLDGIPLAVELAAGLVTVLGLDEIDRRLDDRLSLLTRGSRLAVPRQRTLRAAIDWSYDLLDGTERELLQRLSVFVGDFSLDAAADVAELGDGFLTGLHALVGKSMVASLPGPGGSRRYRLLDSLRHYGLEKLCARGPAAEAAARRLHAVHYMHFAIAADRRLHGPDATDWSTRVVRELANLRAALDWCFAGGDLEVGVELAGALRWWFFGRMGELVQARAWLEGALDREDELPPALRLKALVANMTIAFSQGDYRWASSHGEEAVALAEELGDHRELAVALMSRGGAAVFEGKPERAVECLERSLMYCDELGDRWGRAWVLTFWAVVTRRAGDAGRARGQLEEALSIFRATNDDHNQVIPLTQLALVAQATGDLQAAARYCDDAIVLARRLGDRQLAHGALSIAGRVQLALGRLDQARALLLTSVRSFRGAENMLTVALAVEGLAILAHEDGRNADGLRLWGFTEELRAALVMPLTRERMAERERHVAAARQRVGDEAADQALEAGRRLELREVLIEIESAEDVRAGGAPACA